MDNSTTPDIHFKRINAQNVLTICGLSETLTPQQREMVTDNAVSIAQASFSEHAWMRAIYADDQPIGFVLLRAANFYGDPAPWAVHGASVLGSSFCSQRDFPLSP